MSFLGKLTASTRPVSPASVTIGQRTMSPDIQSPLSGSGENVQSNNDSCPLDDAIVEDYVGLVQESDDDNDNNQTASSTRSSSSDISDDEESSAKEALPLKTAVLRVSRASKQYSDNMSNLSLESPVYNFLANEDTESTCSATRSRAYSIDNDNFVEYTPKYYGDPEQNLDCLVINRTTFDISATSFAAFHASSAPDLPAMPPISLVSSSGSIAPSLITAHGIVGIINLLSGPYLVVITSRNTLGTLHGKTIYEVDTCQMILIPNNVAELGEHERRLESTYKRSLKSLLRTNFYFSYDSDVSNSLQHVEIYNFFLEGHSFEFALISRRSKFRAGTRYNTRGCDTAGNVANYVETEQLLYATDVGATKTFAFTQVRGSIPLVWEQSGMRIKPVIKINPDAALQQSTFKMHFDEQIRLYGPQTICTLLDQRGSEAELGDSYRQATNLCEDHIKDIEFVAFDFHHFCQGNRFDRVDLLIDNLDERIEKVGYLERDPTGYQSYQNGSIRTNCLDCLDRTNLVMSMIGFKVLESQFQKLGLDWRSKDLNNPLSKHIKLAWANNGDAISQQYAGTSALKGDFTRTGKRNTKGVFRDGVNSLTRYYINTFLDKLHETKNKNVPIGQIKKIQKGSISTDSGRKISYGMRVYHENTKQSKSRSKRDETLSGAKTSSPINIVSEGGGGGEVDGSSNSNTGPSSINNNGSGSSPINNTELKDYLYQTYIVPIPEGETIEFSRDLISEMSDTIKDTVASHLGNAANSWAMSTFIIESDFKRKTNTFGAAYNGLKLGFYSKSPTVGSRGSLSQTVPNKRRSNSFDQSYLSSNLDRGNWDGRDFDATHK
eukprot:gene5652-6522_t